MHFKREVFHLEKGTETVESTLLFRANYDESTTFRKDNGVRIPLKKGILDDLRDHF